MKFAKHADGAQNLAVKEEETQIYQPMRVRRLFFVIF